MRVFRLLLRHSSCSAELSKVCVCCWKEPAASSCSFAAPEEVCRLPIFSFISKLTEKFFLLSLRVTIKLVLFQCDKYIHQVDFESYLSEMLFFVIFSVSLR